MALTFLPMRGIFLIVAVVPALFSVAPALAADRLIDACEVAVDVHAEHVALRFPEARRNGRQVELTVEFSNGGDIYQGRAECGFRETSADEPPSLETINAMGRTGPAMFLVSHHAVWAHFAGGQEEASAPKTEMREEPGRQRSGQRHLLALR